MTRKLLLGAGLCAGLLAAGAAQAATPDDGCKAREKAEMAERIADGAPADAPFAVDSGLQIVAGADDASASFRLARTSTGLSSCERGQEIGVTTTWSATVSAPLTDEAEAAFATLDGLAGSTSLELAYSRQWVSRAASPDSDRLSAICRTALSRSPGWKEPAPDAKVSCGAGAVETYAPELKSDFLDLIWGKAPVAWGWGGAAKVGDQSFEYIDATAFKTRTDNETGWSLKLYGSVQRLKDQDLFGISYARERAWNAQDDTILCPGGGGPVTCLHGAAGPPKMAETDVFQVEYRRRFESFAFAVNLSHKSEDDVSAIDVPIYLTPDDKDSLIGGIRLGWRSDKDEVTAAIFVGKPFSLKFGP